MLASDAGGGTLDFDRGLVRISLKLLDESFWIRASGNKVKRRRRYRIDLAAHMAECDANYLRLLKLIPELGDRDQLTLTIRVANQDVAVCIQVLERCPYTTLIDLTQESLVEGLAFELPAPRIVVRLYHDAKSAEVVEFQNERHFKPTYSYPNGEMRQRDEKAQLNRFLSEYLAACLEHGACADRQVVLADY